MAEQKPTPEQNQRTLIVNEFKNQIQGCIFIFAAIAFFAMLANFGVISQNTFDNILEGISGEELPNFATPADSLDMFIGTPAPTLALQQSYMDTQQELKSFVRTMCVEMGKHPDDYQAEDSQPLHDTCATLTPTVPYRTSLLAAICPFPALRAIITEAPLTYIHLFGALQAYCTEAFQ